MPYPGGKNGSGVYQRLINLMPPHSTYIEPFLGSGAVMRLKLPAQVNIGRDLDPKASGLEMGRHVTRADTAGNGGNAGTTGTGGSYRPTPPELVVLEDVDVDGDLPGHTGIPGGAGSLTAVSGGVRSPDPGPLLDPTTSSGGTVDRTESGVAWDVRIGCGLELLRDFPFATSGKILVYCDPPYLLSTRSSKRPIYAHEWTEDHHLELLSILVKLPCYVMVSGYWSEMYAECLEGWHTTQFEAMTRGGRTATEWVWSNFPEPVELHDYQYLGRDYRERESFKKQTRRWVSRLESMPLVKRRALLNALSLTQGKFQAR